MNLHRAAKVIILSFYDSPELHGLATPAMANGFVSISSIGTKRMGTINKFFLIVLFGISAGNLYSQESDSLNAEDVLTMSLSDLMNTKVYTASKVQQQVKNVSATVQVISAEQIKDRGYFTIEEALSDVPGFQFRNIVGFNSYVFMRGATSQNNLILLLVDGVQINELNSGGFYGGGQFNLSDIDRIEIVYGPASALYGTNAVSGIINIITKQMNAKSQNHINLLGGNYKTGLVDAAIKNYSSDNDMGFYISGMYKTSDKADLAGVAGDNNWTDAMENFEHDLSLLAKFRLANLTAEVLYQEKRSSMSTNYKSLGEQYWDKNTLWDIVFINCFVKYASRINERWVWNASLYYRNATVMPNTIDDIIRSTDTTSGDQVGYYRPNQLVGLENQFTYTINERLMIIGGMIGEVEQLSNGFSISTSSSQFIAPPAPPTPNLLINTVFSGFAQIQYKIFDKLSFIGGMRRDFSSYYGQVFTPRLGLVFNDNMFTAKILYNTAFRAPKPWDYTYGLGNDDLKPEKMQSFELALSYMVLDNLSIGSSAYTNLIKNMLTKEFLPMGDRWINKDKLNTLGAEVYLNYFLRDLLFSLNYTFTDSYDQDAAAVPEIAAHTANGGITYAYNSHMKINLRANYEGERKNPFIIPNTGNDIIEGSFVLNGCVSYNGFYGVDIQVKVSNILDREYFHPSNRFAGRYRQPQRTFTMKAGVAF
jgi:outer membrane receptor for ferrienterochelin and colicins